MALCEVSVIPIGTSTPSIGDYIAKVVKTCRDTKMKYQLTAMGTLIEGNAGEIFSLLPRLHEIPFGMGIKRVLTTISIDDRRDKAVGMDDKVKSVLSRLK
jgi:uncharacterized protein (TIGR00106 family)